MLFETVLNTLKTFTSCILILDSIFELGLISYHLINIKKNKKIRKIIFFNCSLIRMSPFVIKDKKKNLN